MRTAAIIGLLVLLTAGCTFSPGTAENCKLSCGTGGICPEGMRCTPQNLCAADTVTSCVPQPDAAADRPPTPDSPMDLPPPVDLPPDRPPDLPIDAPVCSAATCVDDPNPCTQHMCVGNVCTPVNVMGPCPTGICVNGACQCGAQGQPCCGSGGPPSTGGLQCVGMAPNRTCGSCGAVGSPCCTSGGTPCAVGGICNNTTMMCEACGMRGQMCCPSSQCTAGTVCIAGTCQCGGLNQPCCPAPTRPCEVGCCGGGGTLNVCGTELAADMCRRLNFECGMATGLDRCGATRTVACGGCACPTQCTNNRCMMVACQPVPLTACSCNGQCCTNLCVSGRCCQPVGAPCGAPPNGGPNPRCCSGCCNIFGNCGPGPC